MANTRWKDIVDTLRAQGIEVFSPAQHTGDCISPYVVVQNNGTTGYTGISSDYTLYDVLCYVPKDQYSALETYVANVKTVMSTLYPMIVPMHSETPAFPDDTNKSHMISVQYRNNRKQL